MGTFSKKAAPFTSSAASAPTLLSHLKELKKRVVFSILSIAVMSVLMYGFFDSILVFVTRPLLSIPASSSLLYATSLFDGFVIRLKLSIIAGISASIPVHIYQTIRFCFPGLTRREKQFIMALLIAGTGLAGLSFYLSYFQILPYTVRFLTSQEFLPQSVGLLLNYQHGVFYIVHFLLYSMIAFQFPIVLILLLKLNVLTRKALWSASRYVIVGIFVASAVITPPDIVSQIGLALPLVCLYFGTLAVAKLMKIGESGV